MDTKKVFRTLNRALLALTICVAAGFGAANHRVALAIITDGVCPNEVPK